MKDIAVQGEGLVKTFDDTGALSGLNLSVQKGEIGRRATRHGQQLSLLGPSPDGV